MYGNKKITVINYCDEKFEHTRKVCSSTAISVGKADEVIEYSPSCLDDEFVSKNKKILSFERGAGLWIWKPYVILKTLNKIQENDYLLYVDAGVAFINKIELLIPSLEKSGQDIMTFELPLLTEEWTKSETQTYMLSDSKIPHINDNQILATYILMKNTAYTKAVIEEWLKYMQNEVCLLPETITAESNYWNFIEHREDQSVFSIVCRKNGIIPFRDPSQFGIRPYEYAWNPSYSSLWKRYSFRPKKYTNSDYPQILVSTRKHDPVKYIKIERFKNMLVKIRILNKWTYKLRKKALYNVQKNNLR